MNWQLFFSFRGRINRAPYWIVAVCNLLMFLAAIFVGAAFGYQFAFILGGLAFIPLIVSSFAIMIKRLHDRNKSGWWVLFFYVLPMILSGMQKALRTIPEATAVLLGFACAAIAGIISLWMLIELGFLRGTIGPNRYGPDPLV
jgi:uncharacterized membrane protein YhaH (DUF805 family)